MRLVLALALVLRCFEVCSASIGISSGRAADFYVSELPGVAPGNVVPEMHAGLIEVGSKLGYAEASLFFWHVRASKDTHTTVIWLNGGPGCSSMDGNILEIGPLRMGDPNLKQDPTMLYRKHGSWDAEANLLFVDQPFGTGFSDPGDSIFVDSLEAAAKAFVIFLKEYAKIFPEIAHTHLILAGESFAGHYIPHIWHLLELDEEAWASIGGIQGVLLGNPWIDPSQQYMSVPQFVKDHELIPQSKYKELDSLQETCMKDMQHYIEKHSRMTFSLPSCEHIIIYASLNGEGSDQGKCLNVYNIALPSVAPSCGMEWPPDLDQATKYLSREDVREALHAPKKKSMGEKWVECSGKVNDHMNSGEPAKQFVPDIVRKVPLMLMIGDNDFVCNAVGQDRFVKNLEFNGNVGFGDSSQPIETEYGSWQSERNLTMVHVANASHMVPVDELELSRALLMKLVRMGKYSDSSPFKGLPSSEVDGDHDDEDSEPPQPEDEEAINQAIYAAYRRASVVALIVVLIVCAFLGLVWWRRGQGISSSGILHALMHSNMRFTPKKSTQEEYFPLRSMKRSKGRHPSVIIEEDEEDLEAEA